MRRDRSRLVALTLACALVAAPAARAGDESTKCSMAGPAPGYKAVKLHLPEGSSHLSLLVLGNHVSRAVSDRNVWHLAQGIVIVNAETLEIEAHRVESEGTSPRGVVLTADGTDVARQAVPGPDGPFYHTAGRPRAGLAPGTYYAIGFGSDGGTTQPSDWYSVAVVVEGKHSCSPIGSGTVFDIDQTEFTGGTQAYAQAAGSAEDIAHTYEAPTGTDLVVGLLDAGVQGPGEATLSYETPYSAGTVEDTIVPFLSTGGTHAFTASYQGLFPLILAAGVALDLP